MYDHIDHIDPIDPIDHIDPFEPLLPAPKRRDALLEKARHLQRLGLAAKGRAHASVMQALAPLQIGRAHV